MIPKRPDWPCGDYGDAGELLEHEHAVAVSAVKTLQAIGTGASEAYDGLTYDEIADIAAEVLREIKDSGWKG